MLTSLLKKKLKEDKVANIFVNSIINTVEQGFPEVAALINNAPEFVASPNISEKDSDKFLLIIVAGNIKYIPQHFQPYQDRRLIDMTTKKFAHALGLEAEVMQRLVAQYHGYFSKVNHPSKNTLYAMSKAIFFKYGLTDYQDDYFKNMKAPNPIFLNQLHQIVENFIWDWEAFREKYKITE